MTQHVIQNTQIQEKIFTIRNQQVMIDSDLAQLFNVETKALNQAVKRNSGRFPERYCFQLNKDEFENLKSQIVTSSFHGGRRTPPYVFTEQGVTMLSAVLKSDAAVQTSILVVDAFVAMRRFINQNALVFERMDAVERKQLITDTKVDQVLNALEAKIQKPQQGIFYNGQIFEAYAFVSDLVRQATKDIVLIDNYIDETTLTMLSKNQDAKITIYTSKISQQLTLDIEKYNQQYKPVNVQTAKNVHDRFLIIDNQACYLIGASLKDLGKKVFGFSKLNIDTYKLIEGLQWWVKFSVKWLNHEVTKTRRF